MTGGREAHEAHHTRGGAAHVCRPRTSGPCRVRIASLGSRVGHRTRGPARASRRGGAAGARRQPTRNANSNAPRPRAGRAAGATARCVVTTVRRLVCSREKSSKPRSKAPLTSRRLLTARISHAGGTWYTKSHAYTLFFGVAMASSSIDRVLRLRKLCSTDEPMRGILNSWLGGFAIALFRCHWWCS